MARWVTRIFLIVVVLLPAATFAASKETARTPLPARAPSPQFELRIGEAIFAAPWLPAPDVSDGADGLGPLFSATSCRGCHVDVELSATMPARGRDDVSLRHVVRLGDRSTGAPDPHYGRQIQERAIAGHAPEATVAIRWEVVLLAFSGGRTLAARRPSVEVANLAYGPLALSTGTALRRPPPLLGVGVIEAIPDRAILAGADPDDRDGDGISGRVILVDQGNSGTQRVGRFGWRSRVATLAQQAADAFHLDMGLSSPTAPGGAGDCTLHQRDCFAAPDGASAAKGGYEVSAREIELVAAYLAGLPPPATTQSLERIAVGEKQLAALGCAACHRPSFETMPQGARLYSDLLVHDMGEELADAASDTVGVTAREWRTAPLWGLSARLGEIGRGQIDGLLHDGRAQNIAAAIAWHAGEASSARDRFFALNATEQLALVEFMSGL